jgi:two-component system cell cycle sensor histidine kinase/response regulator CckA
MSCASKRSFKPLLWLGASLPALAVGAAGFFLWRQTASALHLAAGAAGLAAATSLVLLALESAKRRRLAATAQGFALVIERDARAMRLEDKEGAILYANKAARALFGELSPLAMIEMRILDEAGSELADRFAGQVRSGGDAETEIDLSARDGGIERLSISYRPLGPDGALRLWTAEDVTARHAMALAQRNETAYLLDLLDALPAGVALLDRLDRLAYVNQRLAGWLQELPESLIGQQASVLLAEGAALPGHSGEIRLRPRQGGEVRAFLETVTVAGSKLYLLHRDMKPETPSSSAGRMVERAAERLFEDAPVGIALIDLEGNLTACNAAFSSMVGLPAESMIGQPLSSRIAQEDRGDVAAQLSKLVLGASRGIHLDIRLMGAREIAATLFAAPIYQEGEPGEIEGIALHFLDTTEQKNLEVQFAQAQKMQAMGQLAGGIAHDFNNLLTAMIGFCDLLLQRHGQGDPSFADIMQIKQNANRAANLVRQLLAFSRRQTLRPRLVDVTDALTELSHLLRRLMGETIELKLEHGQDLGLVRVDPSQFDQVVINLAVNARDAMTGGGALSIRTATARFERPTQRGPELIPPGEYVLIEVADTGTGIPKEHIGRIFEPFFTTKPVGAGTGLGLSTVYGILRQTDGFILADSAPGQGATFTIFLPRYAAGGHAQPPTLMSAADPASQTPADLTGAGTVLLVEDEDAVRLFAVRALRNKGYKVLEARSGEQALDLINSEPVDLMVTDVVMPGMDGVTLTRLVRVEHPGLRVVLISGYAEDTARGGLADLKDIHFLPKPFSLKQLAGTVKDVLSSGTMTGTPHEL